MAYVPNYGSVDSSAGTAYSYKTSTDFGANYGWLGGLAGSMSGQNKAAEDAAAAYNSALSNKFNADEAQKNRNFEEYMSSTAYQRMMADAKKAGINPYYLIQGGSSGSSSQAGSAASSGGSPDSKGSKGSDALGNLASTAIAIAKIAALLAA